MLKIVERWRNRASLCEACRKPLADGTTETTCSPECAEAVDWFYAIR